MGLLRDQFYLAQLSKITWSKYSPLRSSEWYNGYRSVELYSTFSLTRTGQVIFPDLRDNKNPLKKWKKKKTKEDKRKARKYIEIRFSFMELPWKSRSDGSGR